MAFIASVVLTLPLIIRQSLRLDWAHVGWVGWAGMFYMSAFSGVAAYTLFYWVLRFKDASSVTAVNYAQPMIVILLSIPILGEHPTRYFIAGSLLVLLGVYLAERVSIPSLNRTHEWNRT